MKYNFKIRFQYFVRVKKSAQCFGPRAARFRQNDSDKLTTDGSSKTVDR